MTEPRDDGGPAFPHTIPRDSTPLVSGNWRTPTGDIIVPGMSLRDYFAAEALGVHEIQDLVAAKHCGVSFEEYSTGVAIAAYRIADAMIKERSK